MRIEPSSHLMESGDEIEWFRKLHHIYSTKIPQYLKTKVFDQHVLPVLTHAQGPLIMGFIRRFKVTERAMERAMFRVSQTNRSSSSKSTQKNCLQGSILCLPFEMAEPAKSVCFADDIWRGNEVSYFRVNVESPTTIVSLDWS